MVGKADYTQQKATRKMTPNPRILRLHLADMGEDTPVCYLHRKASGSACINAKEGQITLVPPATSLLPASAKEPKLFMVANLPHVLANEDSHVFLSLGPGQAVLKAQPGNEGQKGLSVDVIIPGFVTVSQKIEIWKPLHVGILTVSDKGSRGERTDTAGPALEELVSGIGGEVLFRKIVPDETTAIQKTVQQWSKEGCHLILTTGGTGLSMRDVTPDSLSEIADRTVPGLGELIRMKTVHQTPRSVLSRTIAVTLDQTLAISLPGSERGARECFQVIAPVLRHAVEILLGWGGDCGGHSHH